MNSCACGCGEQTRNTFKRGYVARTEAYKMRMREPDVRLAMSRASKGKPKSRHMREALSRAQRGKPKPQTRAERNGMWKGDEVTSVGAHSRHRRHHPYTGVCSWCGATPPRTRDDRSGTEWAFIGPSGGYSTNPDDYVELCRSCHRRFDWTHRP